MQYYNRHYFSGTAGDSLEHRAKYGTADSVSEEKGTDGKKNNTSEYNHKYYESNKEKWKDNKKSSSKSSSKSDNDSLYYDKDGNARFGHKDYDANDEDFKRTDGELINGTDLRTFTNKNGSTIIMGKGIKFSFPPGTKITEAMARKIAEVESGDKSNKEQYVAKMLNAVTGFADKQGLFGDNKKSSGSSSKSSGKTTEENSSDSKKKKEDSLWDKTISKYNGKASTSSKSAKELAQERGKTLTEYYKKKQKKKK